MAKKRKKKKSTYNAKAARERAKKRLGSRYVDLKAAWAAIKSVSRRRKKGKHRKSR